jgi:hypothetical protein
MASVTLSSGAVASATTLKLQTNGSTDAVIIDASQNVGVGVTPSAWGSKKALEVGNAGSALFSVGANQNYLTSNSYFDGAFKYGATGTATAYQQYAGTHAWLNAASGSAGGTITFTQAMTLDASGNLLVGTTTKNGKLSVYGGAVSSSTYMADFRNGSYVGLILRDDGFCALPSTYDKTTGSAANVYIDTGGALYRSTSSLKYKKNVQDAVHGLADLLALRSVTYQGKSDTDEGKTFGGLIAEEVHAAGLTEFVQYAEDGSPDALAYGNMISLCIKSIQEQQALITQLQADVAALKG